MCVCCETCVKNVIVALFRSEVARTDDGGKSSVCFGYCSIKSLTATGDFYTGEDVKGKD